MRAGSAPTQPSRCAAQDFSAAAVKLDVNEHLRLASTFNSLAMIMKELSPVTRSSRMELLEADSFVLQSFDTATGLKFFIIADPDSKHLDQARGLLSRAAAPLSASPTARAHAAFRRQVLKEVYVLYSDYVMKNPFYELDMPIQCDKFDQKIMKLADDYNRRG